MAEANTKYVLIIEDTEADRKAITACLDKDGVSWKLAGNSVEALQISQEAPPMLIILDILLPGLNGFKLMKLFKSNSLLQEIPVIILSVMDTDSSREQAKKTGAAEYLTKPLNSEKLLIVLKQYLR